MTKKVCREQQPKIVNPRYEGATPEMVGRALLRRVIDDRREDDGQPEPAANGKFQSSI